MQCPCKCQMLDCIVCWQHDGKSKCSSVFLCTQSSLLSWTHLYTGMSCTVFAVTLAAAAAQKAAACANNLPRSLLEVPSTTQNTEIRQSRYTLIKALRNLTCREQRLHCIALTLAWWSTSTKAATLDGKGCIMPIRIALLTPLTYRSLYWEVVHSGRLTTGHLTHRHLPTAHSTSDNSFVI